MKWAVLGTANRLPNAKIETMGKLNAINEPPQLSGVVSIL